MAYHKCTVLCNPLKSSNKDSQVRHKVVDIIKCVQICNGLLFLVYCNALIN